MILFLAKREQEPRHRGCCGREEGREWDGEALQEEHRKAGLLLKNQMQLQELQGSAGEKEGKPNVQMLQQGLNRLLHISPWEKKFLSYRGTIQFSYGAA